MKLHSLLGIIITLLMAMYLFYLAGQRTDTQRLISPEKNIRLEKHAFNDKINKS